MSKQLLIVDDDELLRRSLSFNLERSGYKISTAANAEDGLELARLNRPDLVLLDISLPGMDGLEALRRFQSYVGVPVIFLTGHRRELDEVLGLEMGADDYITKPFDLDVLLARIKVVLRRSQAAAGVGSGDGPSAGSDGVCVGDLEIDRATHTVRVGQRGLDLPPREFDLLYALALDAGKVISTEDLLARVWGAEYEGESQVVYVHIRWLREKVESDPQNPQRIITVRGVGYKLVPVVATPTQA